MQVGLLTTWLQWRETRVCAEDAQIGQPAVKLELAAGLAIAAEKRADALGLAAEEMPDALGPAGIDDGAEVIGHPCSLLRWRCTQLGSQEDTWR
jgi:hypothetical protein